MKQFIRFTLMSLLCITNSIAFGQKLNERITTFTPQLVYNYENKFKIVWPIFFHTWSGKPQFEMVHQSQSMVTPLLTLLSKIESELESEQPIIIRIDFQDKFNQVKIEKQTEPREFIFRDSMLEFEGKNHIIIHSANQAPFTIYYNTISDLQLLKKIEFQILENFITADVRSYSNTKLSRKKEMIYLSSNGELKQYGAVGRTKMNSWGINAMTGAMFAYSKLGVGLNAQINLLNYKQGNDNHKHLATKISLDLKSYIFEGPPSEFKAIYSSFGISAMANQKLIGSNLPIDMIGFGLGVFSLSGIDGYVLQYPNIDPNSLHKPTPYTDNQLGGITYSIIAELQKIYISYDLNIGVFNKSQERSSFNSLNIAYKF